MVYKLSKIKTLPQRILPTVHFQIPETSDSLISLPKMFADSLISPRQILTVPSGDKLIQTNLVESSQLENSKGHFKEAKQGRSQSVCPIKAKAGEEQLTPNSSALDDYFNSIYTKRQDKLRAEEKNDQMISQVCYRNRIDKDPFLKFREQRLKRF